MLLPSVLGAEYPRQGKHPGTTTGCFWRCTSWIELDEHDWPVRRRLKMRQVERNVVCMRESKTQCGLSEGLKAGKPSKLGHTPVATEKTLGVGFS